ncbi:MAG TPA: nitronate monooxygenase [Chthoniobacteraceae bacterium]|nr:nitronate monooxygenase [Chthoniobacteraceae bacterium]
MISNFSIIQGGMGVAVSGWPLARAVSMTGQLGVVAGTALSTVVSRRLQLGDLDGHLRRAFQHFPIAEVAARVLSRYFVPGGKAKNAPFKLSGMPNLHFSKNLLNLTVLANFAEVFLAREGHKGVVGLNLLEKIQFPTLASLYGAMLAGVDYVLMGAGIPRTIPGALDRLARGERAELKIDVAGALPGEEFTTSFDPATFFDGKPPQLKRPGFIAIVSSATLATTLARKSNGAVHGFVIEGPSAGGHNAPPRGTLQLSPAGEPVYGPRDQPELEKFRALGLPFWLAGSYGRPGMLEKALQLGAAGIQAGTPFAFSRESGIAPELKERAIHLSREGKAGVFTDPFASPTGFPLKVAQIEGTLSDKTLYQNRKRICDLGYLRRAYRRPDGTIGYRCPSEPVDDYVRKGGSVEETVNRKCVCNGLTATIGLGQIQADGDEELALVTAGEDLSLIDDFLKPGEDAYTAAEVVERLLVRQQA